MLRILYAIVAMDEKQIVVRRIPVELWRRLKVKAAAEGRTLQELVAAAIQRYLEGA